MIVVPDDFPSVFEGSAAHERARALGETRVYTERGAEDEAELARRIGNAAVAINIRAYARFTEAVFRTCPGLKMISIWGTGTDNIDLAAAARHGVTVCNTPGVNAYAVAEHTIALMLAVARKIPKIDREMRGGAWPREMLAQLHGKTLAVFGTGAVGARVAQLARGFGMEVLTWSARRDTTASKDDILRRRFSEAAVMGGVCYVASTIARPGVIHQTGTMQRVVLGEYDGRKSERAAFLHEALVRSGVNAELSGDVRKAIWEKFVFLVALSATTTTMRTTLGPIRENPQTRAFLLDIMREAVAVGRAQGVALPEDYAESRLPFADGLPADMTSSMHHDLERGNRLEVEWLSGGVVKLGRDAGVPTPANRAVCDILALHAAGRKPA